MWGSSTVRRVRKQLGWTLQRTGYCQLIWYVNKTKRLEFTQSVLESGDTFHNIIFSDESSNSLTQYHRTCWKVDKPAKQKPKPKHPLRVHVWAGISKHGATKICISAGIMDADLFCNILETTLVPFVWDKLPDHRFVQDNDLSWSTRPYGHRPSLRRTELTGGVLPQKVLTLILSGTCDMSWSFT